MGKKNKSKAKSEINASYAESDSLYPEPSHPKKKPIKKSPTHKKKKETSDDKMAPQQDKSVNLELSQSKSIREESECEKNAVDSTIEILEALQNSLQQIKKTYQQSEQEYLKHKVICDTLSETINTKKQKIESTQTKIYNIQKELIDKSIEIDRQLFYDQKTFRDNELFILFYQNLVELPRKIKVCTLVTDDIPLSFTALSKETVQSVVQNIRQEATSKIIGDHYHDFPHFCCPEQHSDLIKAFIAYRAAQLSQKHLKLFSGIFIRESKISKKIILSTINCTYNLIFNDPKQYVIQSIYSLVSEKLSGKAKTQKQIQELISKYIVNRQFICLPEVSAQVRSFRLGGKIYINTYYIEKEEYEENIQILYCVYGILREITNLIVDEIAVCQQKNNSFSQILHENINRTDQGAKMESKLTQGLGITCVCPRHYPLIKAKNINFTILSKCDDIERSTDISGGLATTFIFKQFEEQLRHEMQIEEEKGQETQERKGMESQKDGNYISIKQEEMHKIMAIEMD